MTVYFWGVRANDPDLTHKTWVVFELSEKRASARRAELKRNGFKVSALKKAVIAI